jgi:Putative peptidoglycan binding domain
MTKNILTTLLLLYCLTLFGQPDDDPANFMPGKCYARCLIPDKVKQKLRLPIYKGLEYDDPLIEQRQLRVPTLTVPEAWRQSENGNVSKSKSFIVRKQNQDTVLNVWVVTDTTQIKEYEWVAFTLSRSKAGGFAEWREVLCGDKITSNTVMYIQKKLAEAGYDAGAIDNVMDTKSKQALTQFQKDHGLPVGNLDLETLKVLGVPF